MLRERLFRLAFIIPGGFLAELFLHVCFPKYIRASLFSPRVYVATTVGT